MLQNLEIHALFFIICTSRELLEGPLHVYTMIGCPFPTHTAVRCRLLGSHTGNWAYTNTWTVRQQGEGSVPVVGAGLQKVLFCLRHSSFRTLSHRVKCIGLLVKGAWKLVPLLIIFLVNSTSHSPVLNAGLGEKKAQKSSYCFPRSVF